MRRYARRRGDDDGGPGVSVGWRPEAVICEKKRRKHNKRKRERTVNKQTHAYCTTRIHVPGTSSMYIYYIMIHEFRRNPLSHRATKLFFICF